MFGNAIFYVSARCRHIKNCIVKLQNLPDGRPVERRWYAMNNVTLFGCLTKDPLVSVSEKGVKSARFTLAVNRDYESQNEQTADYIPCVAFGRRADWAEKYLKQGLKLVLSGQLNSGSFVRNGERIYTLNVIVGKADFAESKQAFESRMKIKEEKSKTVAEDGYIHIPDDLEEELPFI